MEIIDNSKKRILKICPICNHFLDLKWYRVKDTDYCRKCWVAEEAILQYEYE